MCGAPLNMVFTALICCIAHMAGAQQFDSDAYGRRENLVDTLLHYEKYEEAIPLLEYQIAYLIKNNRPDSLSRYTYKLGNAYLEARGPEEAISRTLTYVNSVEAKVSDLSRVLTAISDYSLICLKAGKDYLCYEADQRYFNLCANYPGASPLEKSNAHYALGYDFQQFLGNPKKAVYHFQEALKPLLPDSLKYKTRVLDALNALGAAHFRNGDIQLSRKTLSRALAFSELLPDSLNKWIQQGNIYGNLSLGYQNEGDLLTCKDYLYRSIAIRRKILNRLEAGYQRDQQRRHLIAHYQNLASLNLSLGDVSKAYSLTQYVKKMRAEWLAPNHPDNYKTYESLGSIAFAMGDYPAALENYTRYLDHTLAMGSKYSHQATIAYERIAKVLFEQGDYQGAIRNYTESIEISRKISDETSSHELAMSYMLRALPYGRNKEFQKAENDLRTARYIFKTNHHHESEIIRKLDLIYARLKLDQNQIDSALLYVDRTLIQPDTFRVRMNGSVTSLTGNFSIYLPEAWQLRAEIILKQSRDEPTLRKALAYLDRAASYVCKTQYLYLGESSLVAHFDNYHSVFSDLEDLYYDLYRTSGLDAYADSLFAINERHKSVLIRRHLNAFSSLRTAQLPDSVILAEQHLLKQLSDVRSFANQEFDLPVIEADYERFQDFLRKNYPAYYDLKYQNTTISADDICTHYLREGQNLVQYILTDTRAYVMILNKKAKRVVPLAPAGLEAAITSLNAAIIANDSRKFRKNAEAIYTHLMQPVEPFLDGTEIFVVPDGPLFYLNFEALVRPSDSKKPDYLLYHYTFSYLLSASSAFQYHKIPRDAPEGILSFAPGFSDQTKMSYISAVSDTTLLDKAYLHTIQQPFAVAAAQRSVSIFPGKMYVSEAATERNFRNEASRYRIIHLGTHTEINNASPLLSRLVLSKDGSNPSDTDDGYLHAYEIYNMPLHAELAVLTACETGVGKASSSEGIRSLAHSFSYAGCPSIVMALWQIDEKSSSTIIAYFYENLALGMPKNEALLNAKKRYLKTAPAETAMPYYWSGLVLVGDVSPVRSPSGINHRWLTAFLLLTVFVSFLFIPFGKN